MPGSIRYNHDPAVEGTSGPRGVSIHWAPTDAAGSCIIRAVGRAHAGSALGAHHVVCSARYRPSMELNPEVAAMAARLAELGTRGTVTGIRARIGSSKATKRDLETIELLDEIVDELISQRTEILGIAQAFEDELVAERISDDDIAFVTSQLAPKLEGLLDLAGSDADPEEVRKVLELLVSKDTVKILQVLGFNFREAIGRPLTNLVARLIDTHGPVLPADPETIHRLQLENQITLAKLALDPAAYERFAALLGQQSG
jgi:hypothetical protein